MRLRKGVFAFGALLLVVVLLLGPTTPAVAQPTQEPPFAAGRILVKFQPAASPVDRAALHRALGGQPSGEIPGIGVEVVGVPARAEEARAAAYARNPLVAYAEPDYIAYALEGPSDSGFARQWGLNNDGQIYGGCYWTGDCSGTADADIDASEAWGITTGSAQVWIAILDSGIDQDHEDLDKVVANKNFTTSRTVDDRYGHGTHVAGIAAAKTNNGIGVAGVGYDSGLMNGKVLNDRGSGWYSWIANGIVWAADNGAKVINMSLGGGSPSSTLEDAVNYAWSKGVVMLAAAGNGGNTTPEYPARYENCIAVAATDDDDAKASFSTYGSWVDVAAPGVDIYSTFPNHPYNIKKSLNYDYGSGTSMATPHVAGLAALLFGQDPNRSNLTVRALIESTADPIPSVGTYWVYGRINACNAVGGRCTYGAEPTPSPTPEPTPEPGAAMHVASIHMSTETRQAGRNTFTTAAAAVTVVDASDNRVSGATVSGHWTGLTSDTDSGATDANGVVILKSDAVRSASGAFTFTVTGVAKDGWTYDSAANVETSDSIAVP